MRLRSDLASPPAVVPASGADSSAGGFAKWATLLLVLAAADVPVTLLWDYSWESTVGIDHPWAPPHIANYLSVALAGLAGLALVFDATRRRADGVRLGRWSAPAGAWLAIWGAGAFLAAVLFDRWWQSGYGLAAGIWHPPQLLKAVAFFAVISGAWLCCLIRQDRPGGAVLFALASGVLLAMISVVTTAWNFPNRQHSAPFFQIACGTYPLVLAAVATAGRRRFSATLAALTAMLLLGAMVWLLPLIPGAPQASPIYHPRDHLLPPPFPLLLVMPALALDALLGLAPARPSRFSPWAEALETGLAFFLIFTVTQWLFAQFLLSPAADHWFFAGGGKHWPFFLKIHPSAQTAFWKMPGDEWNLASGSMAAGLAIVAARLGLWIGAWMQRVQR